MRLSRCHIVVMVSLSTKNFLLNMAAKQIFSDIITKMARNFLDMVLKSSDNVRKIEHRYWYINYDIIYHMS